VNKNKKDFGSHNNTRHVMFEKAQVYYYNTTQVHGVSGMIHVCIETCHISKVWCKIGSDFCKECRFNVGFHIKEQYIICKKIKQIQQRSEK